MKPLLTRLANHLSRIDILKRKGKKNHQCCFLKDTHTVKKGADAWQRVPFLPGQIESALLPSPRPSPAPPVSQRLAALIYLMEGILCRALVVSLYCNLSPHQMFLHLNTVMFISKSPRKRIKWSQHVYVRRGPTEVMGKVTAALGAGERARRRIGGQKEVLDMCTRQLMTPG